MPEQFFAGNRPTGLENSPQATVTVADFQVDEQDNLARYKDLEGPRAIYADYQVNNSFSKNRHIHMLPLTSPNGFKGQSAVFIQLANPVEVWQSEWSGCRWKSQPEVPDPAVSDPNWVLISEDLEPVMTYGPDGNTPLYRVNGVYIYGRRNPEDVTVRDVFFGLSPEFLDEADRTMSEALLRQNIINTPAKG